MSKYQELVKSFDNIRKISQDFFIYGYNGRGDFPFISDRMYDNELRRIKSYLKNYVITTQTKDKKTISISSNTIYDTINPLFELFSGKSFTSKDCFLHFVLLDILSNYKTKTLNEIYDEILDNYDPIDLDIMTVRNKLHEYIDLGIIILSKENNKNLYTLQSQIIIDDKLIETIIFFQNIVPLGYILNPITSNKKSSYIYKQVFFSNVLDDEYVLILLNAIENKQPILIKQRGRKNNVIVKGMPIGIYQNMITGRRYLKVMKKGNSVFVRIDKIEEVSYLDTEYTLFEENNKKEYIKVLIHIDDNETFIVDRIYREINEENIIKIDENTYQFTLYYSNLFDSIPYVRSYFGRILKLESDNKQVLTKLERDLFSTISLYEDGE